MLKSMPLLLALLLLATAAVAQHTPSADAGVDGRRYSKLVQDAYDSGLACRDGALDAVDAARADGYEAYVVILIATPRDQVPRNQTPWQIDHAVAAIRMRPDLWMLADAWVSHLTYLHQHYRVWWRHEELPLRPYHDRHAPWRALGRGGSRYHQARFATAEEEQWWREIRGTTWFRRTVPLPSDINMGPVQDDGVPIGGFD